MPPSVPRTVSDARIGVTAILRLQRAGEMNLALAGPGPSSLREPPINSDVGKRADADCRDHETNNFFAGPHWATIRLHCHPSTQRFNLLSSGIAINFTALQFFCRASSRRGAA